MRAGTIVMPSLSLQQILLTRIGSAMHREAARASPGAVALDQGPDRVVVDVGPLRLTLTTSSKDGSGDDMAAPRHPLLGRLLDAQFTDLERRVVKHLSAGPLGGPELAKLTGEVETARDVPNRQLYGVLGRLVSVGVVEKNARPESYFLSETFVPVLGVFFPDLVSADG